MKNLILPLCLLLAFMGPALGQSEDDPATQAMVELTAEIRKLVELLGARAELESRSATIQQVAALDRSILEVDRELRQTLQERETLAAEVREKEVELESAEERALSTSQVAALIEQMKGYADKLRAELAEIQVRRNHLDRRVDELQQTLDRRIALRAELESSLEPDSTR